jgi:hypothetical protein
MSRRSRLDWGDVLPVRAVWRLTQTGDKQTSRSAKRFFMPYQSLSL